MKGQTDNTGTSAVFSSPAQILSLYVQGMIAGLILASVSIDRGPFRPPRNRRRPAPHLPCPRTVQLLTNRVP